jgi:hypothetical protein
MKHVVCCTMDTQVCYVSANSSCSSPGALWAEEQVSSERCTMDTQSMLMSPLALRHEEHVYLCCIWTEYADVSASTPASPGHYEHEEHV